MRLLCHFSVASRALYIGNWTMELNWRLIYQNSTDFVHFLCYGFFPSILYLWVSCRVVLDVACANPIKVWCKASVWQLLSVPNLMGHIWQSTDLGGCLSRKACVTSDFALSFLFHERALPWNLFLAEMLCWMQFFLEVAVMLNRWMEITECDGHVFNGWNAFASGCVSVIPTRNCWGTIRPDPSEGMLKDSAQWLRQSEGKNLGSAQWLGQSEGMASGFSSVIKTSWWWSLVCWPVR
jgi:hypothetical protein